VAKIQFLKALIIKASYSFANDCCIYSQIYGGEMMISQNQNEYIPKTQFEAIPVELEVVGKKIVDAAFHVHKALGPGLLEKVYEICFCHELDKRGVLYLRQLNIPIVYDGITFQEGLRLDVLVEEKIIVEIKAVEQVNPVWEAQILSHLKLTDRRLGFLINFDVVNIRHGIRRFVV
jgi:GxxExxY protein